MELARVFMSLLPAVFQLSPILRLDARCLLPTACCVLPAACCAFCLPLAACFLLSAAILLNVSQHHRLVCVCVLDF